MSPATHHPLGKPVAPALRATGPKPLIRRLWDRMSIYLPIILMGILALGTYWLVRNTPTSTAADTKQVAKHEPDYFMRTFSVKTFNPQGVLQSEVSGVEGRHFPDTDTLEIDQVRIRSFDAQGFPTLATANRALSNADGSEVQLFGNAIVVREANTPPNGRMTPRMEFRSEFLHAYAHTEQVHTDKPVVLMRGQDRFTGDSMKFDNINQILQLQGRVHGVLMPGLSAQKKSKK